MHFKREDQLKCEGVKVMIIFDAHCDTITELMTKNKTLFMNNLHIDLLRMKEYEGYVQFFAVWIDPQYKDEPLKRALQMMDVFFTQVNNYNNHIAFVTNYIEAMEAIKNGKIAAFLTIEGGEALQGDLSILRMLYKLGIRSIGLTWNGKNEIGAGVGEADEGLTPFGIELIKEMNKLGMLIDVSHLSPKGFWDVIAHTRQPIIASHSNAIELCNHKRNITAEQFKAIASSGGVVGINFFSYFLTNNGEASHKDIINHIEYFMGLGGENHIGLGSDFDGIDKTPIDINGIQELDIIFNALLQLNYSQEQVEKIAGFNFLNVIKKIKNE